jgi:hypothetical protein
MSKTVADVWPVQQPAPPVKVRLPWPKWILKRLVDDEPDPNNYDVGLSVW